MYAIRSYYESFAVMLMPSSAISATWACCQKGSESVITSYSIHYTKLYDGLGLAVSLAGMVACGMLFCLAAGEFDLSVGSIVACSGVTCAVAINATESVTLGILAGMAIGIFFGLVNGFVVAKFKSYNFV